MSELDPHRSTIEIQQQELKRKYLSLAEQLSQHSEGFSFPGVDEETRETLRAVDEEYPGYVTPVDELVTRMESEGIKIVLGEDPNSGNVFVVPLLSNNIAMDSLFPRHLTITRDIDESLRLLIHANQEIFNNIQLVEEESQSPTTTFE